MIVENNKPSMARIEVQKSFCDGCSLCIKKELQKVNDIKNIRLYPKDSIITFNFVKANKLSTVLNVLSEIGYSEKGERVNKHQLSKLFCSC